MYPQNRGQQPDPYNRPDSREQAERNQPGARRQPGPDDYDDWYRPPGPAGQHRQPPAGYPQPPAGYPQPDRRGYRQPDRRGYPQPGDGYPPAAPAAPPRRKRRVFLWSFFAVQALFLIWLISGLTTGHDSNATALAQACDGHNWYPLFSSHADCMTHYNSALNDAQNVGKGIGVALIVVIWIIADFFLGLGYAIYRLASRPR